MYQHICLPSDGSPLSEHAVAQGLALAQSMGARVTVLSVILPFHAYAVVPEQLMVASNEEYLRATRDATLRHLDAIAARAKELGVACETVAVVDELPWQAIIDTANERGCDLIAMASHGRRGIKALVLGSETLKVLTHSTIPVLVYRTVE